MAKKIFLENEHNKFVYFTQSAGLTTDLFIIGNGLGLAWDQPRRLNKSAKDTWTLVINFTGSWDGYVCSKLDGQLNSCFNDNRLTPDDRFEYRIMTSSLSDMVGSLYSPRL